jgi:hypothetical protein
VLWNEKNEPPAPPGPYLTSAERITQVWFAGVHANVGGGYPDDSLAQIPLYWIMEEARACGLTFKAANPEAIAEIRSAQDKDGRLYDSRSGFASYYRYGPRRLSRLSNELFSRTLADEVEISVPKIHETVLRRIQNNAHVYAPIGIPHKYDVVVTVPNTQGSGATFQVHKLPTTSSLGAPHIYEFSNDAAARVTAEREKIWPLVRLRALLYFLTLAATAFFIIFPLTGRSDPLGEELSPLKWVSDIIRVLSSFLPGWASQWIVGYTQYPLTFIIVVTIIGALLFSGGKIAASISDEMNALWKKSMAHALLPPARSPSNKPVGKEKLFFNLRLSWKEYLGPALSAIVIVYAVITVGNRWLFTALDDAGLVCKNTKNPKDIPEGGILVSFPTSDLCFSTRYKVGRLDRIYIWTNPDPVDVASKYTGYATDRVTCTASPGEPMSNGSVVANAKGYSTFNLLRDMVRWDFLDPDPDTRVKKISEYVVPKVTGELFFYLNDAVFAVPRSWQWLYETTKAACRFLSNRLSRLAWFRRYR